MFSFQYRDVQHSENIFFLSVMKVNSLLNIFMPDISYFVDLSNNILEAVSISMCVAFVNIDKTIT